MTYSATSTTYQDRYINMNVATTTTEFLPSPSTYHGRIATAVGGGVPDIHGENSFRWPHGINERNTNHNNVDRTSAPVESHRLDFRYNNDTSRYPPYETTTRHDIPSSSSSMQDQHFSSRYDFYGNQYQKPPTTDFQNMPTSQQMTNIRPPAYYKKEGLNKSPPTSTSELQLHFSDPRYSQQNSFPAIPQAMDSRYGSTPLSYPSSVNRQDSRSNIEEENPRIKSRNYFHYGNHLSHTPGQTEPLEKIQKTTTSQSPLISSQPSVESLQQKVNQQNPPSLSQGNEKLESKSLFREEFGKLSAEKNKEDKVSINQEKSCADGVKPNVTIKTETTGKTLESKEQSKPTNKKPSPSGKEDTTSDNNNSSNGDKGDASSVDNGLPSYTAMIAQAILKKETSKSTLSDIYEYLEKHFPSLEKRGTGWRNCVRHTLSLNDCFIKLHRPENGRSCNWAIHPTYYESFSRGDYRKRRALRKRPRGLQWIDPAMLNGYPFLREHEMYPDMPQQPSPFYHYPQPGNMNPGSPQGLYHSSNFNPISPNHTQHFPSSQSHSAPIQPYTGGGHYSQNYSQGSGGQLSSTHCTNPGCYCQNNKVANESIHHKSFCL